MSDPENIFAQQVSDDYMALERQGKSGQQDPYSQQGTYGQAGYGQPVYGQPLYASPANYEYESIRSSAMIVMCMAGISFFIAPLILSVSAWVWGHSLVSKARSIGAPQDVVDRARAGWLAAMIIRSCKLAASSCSSWSFGWPLRHNHDLVRAGPGIFLDPPVLFLMCLR